MTKPFINVLPIETLALASLGLTMALSWTNDLALHLPDKYSFLFIINHYVSVMLPGLSLLLSASLLAIIRHKFPWLLWLRIMVALMFILLAHFNLKLWSSLINMSRWDATFHQLDLYFWQVTLLTETFYNQSKVWVSFLAHPYHDLFLLLFLVSFTAHAVQKNVLERVIFACAIVLILGGLSYAVMPAWGPFLYISAPDKDAQEVQQMMLMFYRDYTGSHGQHYQGQYLTASLAAMPSLHLAHALLLTLYAARYMPVLTIFFVPVTAWIACAALTLKWHYFIDLPAGLALALISFYIAEKYGQRPGSNE